MNRYRWFTLKLPRPLHSFARDLEKCAPFNGSGFGFITTSDNNADRLLFRFLKQNIIKIPALASNGELIYQSIKSIESLEFEIFEKNSSIWLKIEDPPRSIREFFNGLEHVAGFGFAAQSFIFSVEDQEKTLLAFDESRLIGFKGVGTSITKKFITRIDVASKEGIDPKKLDLLSGLDFKTDQTTYEVSYRMLRGQVTFTATGLVRMAGSVSPFLVNSLESVL